MTREQLIQKVYRCIDETYPDTTEQDMGEFNLPAFLDEAVRWVVKAVPVGALGGGTTATATKNADNTYPTPNGFLRLLRFKMQDWKVAVTDARPEDDPKYFQQQNPALRGGNARPMVFLVKGETALEVFPDEGDVKEYKTFNMTKGEDGYYTENAYASYPEKLLDVTAWKTAELIFSTMQDANGVSVAQTQIQNIMPTL